MEVKTGESVHVLQSDLRRESFCSSKTSFYKILRLMGGASWLYILLSL